MKFQVSLPTPIAPTYNNMVPADRPALLPALTEHLIGEVEQDRRGAFPMIVSPCNGMCARKCWPGKVITKTGPVDFRSETLAVLTEIGDAVPAAIELGYHFCYGSPADEHCVQPKDMAIMVEMANAIGRGVERPIQFFHMPVPKRPHR